MSTLKESSQKQLSLSFSLTHLVIISHSIDRTVKIYNVSGNSYEHTATLQGHEGPVWQVSWAHPKFGVLLASCGFDGSVLIHRETHPRQWTLLYANHSLHESSVNGLAFCPNHDDRLQLAAASSDGKVSILTHQGAGDNSWTVQYLDDNALGVNAVSWAPSGAYYDSDNPDAPAVPHLVTGGCDNRIRFWSQNLETGEWTQQQQQAAPAHADWVRDVAWAPPLLPLQNVVASCSEDKKVLIWTQDGGADAAWKSTLLHEFEAPVWRVSWSLTAQMLAVSSGDNDVSLWRAGLDGTWSQMSTTDGGQGGGGAGVEQ